jgi:hypothetical protein
VLLWALFLVAFTTIPLELFFQSIGRPLMGVVVAALVFAVLLSMVFSAIVVALLHIVLHEAGHVLFGRAVGFRPYLFQVANYRWFFTPTGRYFDKVSLSYAVGGLAGSVPPRDADRLRWRVAFWGLGGIVVNAVLGGIGHVAWLSMGEPNLVTLTFVLPFVAFLCLLGYGLALTNALPFRQFGVLTDGAFIFALLRNKPAGLRWSSLIILGTAGQRGERPSQFEARPLELALAAKDGTPEHALALLYKSMHHFDNGDYVAARAAVDEALPLASKKDLLILPALRGFAAFISAWCDGDAEGAKELVEDVDLGYAMLPWTRSRTLAAIALAEGNLEEAAAHLADFRRILVETGLGTAGYFPFDVDLLEEMEARLHEIRRDAPLVEVTRT